MDQLLLDLTWSLDQTTGQRRSGHRYLPQIPTTRGDQIVTESFGPVLVSLSVTWTISAFRRHRFAIIAMPASPTLPAVTDLGISHRRRRPPYPPPVITDFQFLRCPPTPTRRCYRFGNNAPPPTPTPISASRHHRFPIFAMPPRGPKGPAVSLTCLPCFGCFSPPGQT